MPANQVFEKAYIVNEADNTTASTDLAVLTGEIVAAYVSHNSVQASSLPELIASVHASLTGLGTPSVPDEPDVRVSAGEVRKSIKPEGLVSFVDGKSYKTLKRHLSKHGLDGASYRAKYGLPHDYPMVAASYAAQRSELAKKLGLGQIRRNGGEASAATEAKLDAILDEGEAPAPKKRGRKPAAAKAASVSAVKGEPVKKTGRPRKTKAA